MWLRLLILCLCYMFVSGASTKMICTCEPFEEQPTTHVPVINVTVAPTPVPVLPGRPTGPVSRVSRDAMRCISFYGLETNLRNIVCSWKHNPAFYLEKCKESGFNTIRVPVSLQYIVESNFDVLDSLFEECAKRNMSVLLDFHRVSNNRQEESWDQGIKEYSPVHSRHEFLNGVISIVGRYARYPQLVGLNSWNEYVGTNIQYKKEWDRFIFDEVEASFPGRFWYFPSGMYWANTLEGYSLEDAPYAGRIIYTVHKYHFSGTGDYADWDRTFGKLYPPEKLMIGEFGFRDPEDMAWGGSFVSYIKNRNISHFCFWTIAHSADTGGLWKDDCDTFNVNKFNVLKPILFPNASAGAVH